MVFSSVSFLYGFLPAVIVLYFLAPKCAKNGVLLLASLIFYYIGEQKLILLMLACITLNYLAAFLIDRFRTNAAARVVLVLTLTLDIGMLVYYKYTDFFISNINALTGSSLPLQYILLPIGISFYTFQIMSYTIDVYRNKVKPQRNFLTLATYVALFPQLIAGPIVRYSDIAGELEERMHSFENMAHGIRRFIIGLSKKVLLANTLAELGKTVAYSSEKSVLFAWLGAVAFLFQIYFDFSGYSDMAIGIGRMFGFHFPENFRYPYTAVSITDFWRRWHISLSSWFRDYLYIPLGGNRCKAARWCFNILVVWFATGLWHGASWNFVIWGVYFGLILAFEKLFFSKLLLRAPRLVGRIYTMLIVLLGFVIFNAKSASIGFENIAAMLGLLGIAPIGDESIYYLKSYLPIFIIAAVASTPLLSGMLKRIAKFKIGGKILRAAEPICLSALLIISTGFLVGGSFNPFLYFRF